MYLKKKKDLYIAYSKYGHKYKKNIQRRGFNLNIKTSWFNY